MNTQTFAQDQGFTAITDEELMAVNGGVIPLILGQIFRAAGTQVLKGAVTGAGGYGGYRTSQEIFG